MAVYRPTYRDPKTGEIKQSAVFWCDFIAAGSRVRESTHVKRKTLATLYENYRRLELERAIVGQGPKKKTPILLCRVADAIDIYERDYELGHRPKSIAWVKERLTHVRRLLNRALFADLNDDRIRNYMSKRIEERVSNRTVNMEIECLSRAIGKEWRQLWPGVLRLEENKDVGVALEPSEEERIIQAAQSNRSPLIFPFLRVLFLTGARDYEVRTLQWGRSDFRLRLLRIGRSKTRAGAGREIPMGDELQDVLARHAEWYQERFGALQPEWYVFPFSNRVRPIDPTRPVTTIKSAWESVRKAAGVNCRLHDIRHTVATKMAEAGIAESTMLALLGHMNRSMLERYSHIRTAAKREAVKALEGQNPVEHVKEIPKVSRLRRIK